MISSVVCLGLSVSFVCDYQCCLCVIISVVFVCLSMPSLCVYKYRLCVIISDACVRLSVFFMNSSFSPFLLMFSL